MEDQDLEVQFKAIADEINNKIKVAAAALNEANEIAKKHGLKTLHIHPYADITDYGVKQDEKNMHYEVIDRVRFRPLLDAMDGAGWSSSGFEC